jgi:hypothetical protein
MDLRFADLQTLGSALRGRQVSPRDLAEATIDGLAMLGVAHNAVATLLRDRAYAEAEVASRRLADGDDNPLLGIPYAVKDLFSARGGPTTWGSAVFADRVIDKDAAAIARLAAAGGVLTAKLAMSEFAGGGRPIKPGASMHGQGRTHGIPPAIRAGRRAGPASPSPWASCRSRWARRPAAPSWVRRASQASPDCVRRTDSCRGKAR